jgi:hypothetical protein
MHGTWNSWGLSAFVDPQALRHFDSVDLQKKKKSDSTDPVHSLIRFCRSASCKEWRHKMVSTVRLTDELPGTGLLITEVEAGEAQADRFHQHATVDRQSESGKRNRQLSNSQSAPAV